jgi:hypothetical protein
MRNFERIFEDLHYALRSLRRRPSFTLIAIVSLTVALGANTAVFSFARAIVIKTLAVPGADRLVILRQHNEMFHIENCCFHAPVLRGTTEARCGVRRRARHQRRGHQFDGSG